MRLFNFLLALLAITIFHITAKPVSHRDTIPVELAEIEALLASAAAVTCDICQEVLNKTQIFLQNESTVYASAMFAIREAVSPFSLQSTQLKRLTSVT
jgi:hypothetical protein